MTAGTVGVKQSPDADRQIDNDTDGTVYRQKVWDAGPVGTWGYTAGTSGTVTLTGSKRVLAVTVHASSAATFTINSGNTITVPASTAVTVDIKGQLTDPVFVFTGTDSYLIEHVT